MKVLTKVGVCACLAAASFSAAAYEPGDILLRFGAAQVAPDASASPNVIGVDDATTLGVSATFMQSSNWGIEVLAAAPFEHDVPEIPSGQKAGSVKQLPPTVSAHWYPSMSGNIQPYVGLGLNYTVFFDEKFAGPNSVDLDDSFGLTVQLGVDVSLNNDWFVNAALWKMDIDTDATVYNAAGVQAGVVDLEIDPMVYMVGLGRKF